MGKKNNDRAAKSRLRNFNNAKLLRMDILSGLYKRGYSYREMRAEVMARLDLKSYSLETVKKDIDSLLAEWRETRIEGRATSASRMRRRAYQERRRKMRTEI